MRSEFTYRACRLPSPVPRTFSSLGRGGGGGEAHGDREDVEISAGLERFGIAASAPVRESCDLGRSIYGGETVDANLPIRQFYRMNCWSGDVLSAIRFSLLLGITVRMVKDGER